MIVGIGTDLCRVSRIRRSLHRFGDAFATSYCCAREIEHANAQADPAASFAQCFAIKEAFAKACGSGINRDLWWDDVETVTDDGGMIRLRISNDAVSNLKTRLRSSADLRVHVTTSRKRAFCAALVVIESL